MITYLFGLAVGLVAPGLPVTPAVPQVALVSEPALRAEAADSFRDSQRLGKVGFDTTFEVVTYPAVPVGKDTVGLPPSSRTQIRYLVARDCMRVESMRLGESELWPVLQVNVWADGEWSHRRDDERYVAFSDRAGPVDVPGQGYLFNLMDGRFPGLLPITRILREGRLRSQSKRDDIVHSEFVPSFGRDGMVVYTIAFRSAPAQEMERLTIEIFTGEPKACKTRQVFQVTAWKDYDGVRLPETAELQAWQASIATDEMQGEASIVTTYRRTTFRLLDPNADLSQDFRTPLPLGTRVHDARQGMSYEIGADYLYIDGVMYQLQEPLSAPPGESLSVLMRTAKRRTEGPSAQPGEPSLRESALAEWRNSTSRGWVQVTIGGLVVASVFVTSILVLRRWRRPAN